MRSSSRATAYASLALVLAGCGKAFMASLSSDGEARYDFSRANACPQDRVTLSAVALESPPPEVAADPERLRVWRDGRSDWVASWRASGCGHTQTYRCRRGSGADGDTGSAQYECIPVFDAADVASALAGTAAGGVLERIRGPNVIALQARYDMPHVPDSFRGLRVLVSGALIDAPSGFQGAADASDRCARTASLPALVGWVPVYDATQPHDLVMRVHCTLSVQIATVDGVMYLLLPNDANAGVRLENPKGELIDQFAPMSDTLRCPAPDQAGCAAAASAYADHHFLEALVGSPAFAKFVAAR